MDHFGIQKRKRSRRGEFYNLQLHGRLELFKAKEPTAAQQLLALKWLGNSGAHEAAVTIDDLLDGFEILEHNLVEILEQRAARVAGLAKNLTKKHRRGH